MALEQMAVMKPELMLNCAGLMIFPRSGYQLTAPPCVLIG